MSFPELRAQLCILFKTIAEKEIDVFQLSFIQEVREPVSEKQIEALRQVLSEQEEFNPTLLFEAVDPLGQGFIDSKTLLLFLRYRVEYGHSHLEFPLSESGSGWVPWCI